MSVLTLEKVNKKVDKLEKYVEYLYSNSGGGPATSIDIGTTTVTGGATNGVLYQNSSAEISQSGGLKYDDSINTLSVLNGSNSNSQSAHLYVNAGGDAYAAEFEATGSFAGILIKASNAAGLPFLQINNSANSKFWTQVLNTDNTYSFKEGNAAGTEVLRFNTGGTVSLSTYTTNGFVKTSASTGALIVENAPTLDRTITAGATTGDQVINKAAGTVNFAAAATAITVTNNLVNTSSIIFAVVRTNDSTALIKNVVPGNGSFVIRLNAAANAETSVGFWITN